MLGGIEKFAAQYGLRQDDDRQYQGKLDVGTLSQIQVALLLDELVVVGIDVFESPVNLRAFLRFSPVEAMLSAFSRSRMESKRKSDSCRFGRGGSELRGEAATGLEKTSEARSRMRNERSESAWIDFMVTRLVVCQPI
jgi:hypothetical protein